MTGSAWTPYAWAHSPAGRRLRLRGIHVRVVVPGTLRVGEPVETLPVAVTA